VAFLDVIVRTFGKRPAMLERNLASLAALEDSDWRRVLVVDDQARGVAWAVGNLATVQISGEYSWVLDDDDLCCRPSFLGELRTIAATENWPDVIMVRAFHERFGLLPDNTHWQERPVCGQVGTSCYIVRGEVWNAHRAAWQARYEGDYLWIDYLWQQPGLRWYWHDVTAAWYPQQSQGAPEELLLDAH
jgi:glycosyltransferase involved in cell wall biosynthesis